MRLILQENSFKFNDKHYLQTLQIAMGKNSILYDHLASKYEIDCF